MKILEDSTSCFIRVDSTEARDGMEKLTESDTLQAKNLNEFLPVGAAKNLHDFVTSSLSQDLSALAPLWSTVGTLERSRMIT